MKDPPKCSSFGRIARETERQREENLQNYQMYSYRISDVIFNSILSDKDKSVNQ